MESPVQEVAVFGGSFDPPHCAHVLAVAYALSCTPCTRAVVIPTFAHAFQKGSLPFRDRIALCRAAFRPFGRRVAVLDVEARLPTPSYTVQTLEHLREIHPDWRLTLVIGSDIVPETPRWRDFERVRSLARIRVLARAGFPDPTAQGPEFPALSSTDLRRDLAAGRDVSAQVPRAVLDLIRKRGLYRHE